MKKIAIFADVQNIYYTCKQSFNRQFNYRKFWQQVASSGEIRVANAYAIERNDEQQQKFQTALEYIGFDIKLKPFIQRSDGTAKGDWDVGITIDVLEAAADVDTVILLSGDGDFAILLRKIREKYNCKAEVYGVTELTAKSLMDSASTFHPIEEELLL